MHKRGTVSECTEGVKLMRTEEEIRDCIKTLEAMRDDEIENTTDNPVMQWCLIKQYHAQIRLLEEVLEDKDGGYFE